MLNKKMLIAPILAIALVLSLTAAVTYLPLSPQMTPKSQSSTVSTPAPTSQPGGMYSMNSPGASPTQLPVPAPTTSTSPSPASIAQTFYFLPALFVAVAVVLGVLAVQVLFREKDLKKELNSEGE